MILRRFTLHIKEQNWFAVGLDIVVVMAGIFLGLQVTNLNEARIAGSATQTYYARLIDDLRAEETSRLTRITYYQRTKQHAEAALYALKQPDNTLGEQFLIDIYQATQIWPYTPQRTTYDELISGSIANAIPDATLRGLLANYFVNLENSKVILQDRTPFRDNLRRHMPHAIQSAVRKNCGDRYDFQSNNILHLILPDTCDLTLDPFAISEAITALRSYGDLEKDLAHHLSDLDSKLTSLDAHLSTTRKVVKKLEEISR